MNISLPGAAIGTGLMIWCLTLLFRRKKAFNTASLSGKHVVITGASSGIGLALAKQALEEGAFVTLVARNINKLEKSVKSLLSEVKLSNSDNILTKVADVGDYAAISQVIEEAHAWRPIDMLVCNAGLTRGGFLEDLTVEDLDTVVKTNLLGSVYPVHAALPLMKQRSKSHPTSIVFIGSLASLCWLYGNGIYTATKYAVKGMAECLRLEVAPYNMRVHLVCPGFVESAFLDDACKSKELQEGMKVASLYDRKHAQTPEEVAAITYEGIKEGTFLITTTPGLGPILAVLTRGMVPHHSFWRTLSEAVAMFPMRLLSIPSQANVLKQLISIHQKHNPSR